MKQYLGLESNIEKSTLKNLKDGDILYSAVFDNNSQKTEVQPFLFRGYVDAPNNSKGIWAKYVEAYFDENDNKYVPMMKNSKKEDGTYEEVEDIKVNDISIGLFLDKKEALIAFEKTIKKIHKSILEVLKEYK